MKQIKIGKDAAQELEKAADWYESEQKGLGSRLISAFEHAIKLLSEPNPPLCQHSCRPIFSVTKVTGVGMDI